MNTHKKFIEIDIDEYCNITFSLNLFKNLNQKNSCAEEIQKYLEKFRMRRITQDLHDEIRKEISKILLKYDWFEEIK